MSFLKFHSSEFDKDIKELIASSHQLRKGIEASAAECDKREAEKAKLKAEN